MKIRNVLLALLLPWLTFPVAAADFVVSGFGTVGYAQSDQSFAYQRYIDDKGTFARDSIFGVQVDAKFTPQWSATLQAKLAPSIDKDNSWDPTISWAFLSWRPSNDWLLRLGKLRIPMYLNSENMDVGATFSYARLPFEMYSMAPTLDFNGASFNKTWDLTQGELSLEGYWGTTGTTWRDYLSTGVPGLLPVGPLFGSIDVTARGLAVTYRADDNVYRLGAGKATARLANGVRWLDGPVLFNPLPGVSYYVFQPGPGIPDRRDMDIPIINASVDIGLGNEFRLAAEYAVRKTSDMQRGLNSKGGYMSLRKQIGKWTPYVYYAQLRSDGDMIDLYRSVASTTVPSVLPGSALINASQRAIADGLVVYDQNSWSIGTSYALSPSSKLKAEWMRTRVRAGSSMVDAPPGSDVSNQSINVFSMSYSFVF